MLFPYSKNLLRTALNFPFLGEFANMYLEWGLFARIRGISPPLRRAKDATERCDVITDCC